MIIDILSCDYGALLEKFKNKRDSGMIIGFTSGCFDMAHYYHLQYLKKCKTFCNYLVVGVDSDASVRRQKGDSRPIFPQKHRVGLVESMSPVDDVVFLPQMEDLDKICSLIRPTFFIINQDYENVDFEIYGAKYAQSLLVVPDIITDDISSTSSFIKKIKESI